MSDNLLENTDTLELVDRFNNLITKYGELALELAPKLEKFGKYRKELQMISVEFVRRGYTPQEPDSLKKILEEAVEQRTNDKNGNEETDTPERDIKP